MTAIVVLVSYALLVGIAGIPLLERAGWLERTPRLGVLAWQVVSMSVLAALLLAGITAAVPAAAITSARVSGRSSAQ